MIELLFALFGLLASAFFSSYEIAYVVREKSVIQSWYQGPIRTFLADSHKVIITILIGTNIANILVAITMTQYFLKTLNAQEAFVTAGLLATVLILFFGELIPKGIARAHPDAILRRSTRLLFVFYQMVKWLVTLFDLSLAAPIKRRERKSLVQEIEDLIWKGHWERGDLTRQEFQILSNIVGLFDRKARDLMKPLREVFALSVDTPIEKIFEMSEPFTLGKFPVYKGKIDNIVGMVHIKDLFGFEEGDQLEHFVRPVAFVYDDWGVEKVLNQMKRQGVAYAVVVDEYGNCLGWITLQEILRGFIRERVRHHKTG